MKTKMLIVFGLGFALTQSKESHALALSSTGIALGGGVVAIIGATMVGDDDEKVAKKGKRLVKSGLIISAVCSALGTVLYVAAVATLASADKIDTIEAEVENGGGPTIDALAAGFDLPKTTVITALEDGLALHVNVENPNLERFQQAVVSDLESQLEFTTFTAAETLIALHDELQTGSMGEGSRHKMIADFSGVPVSVVSGVVENSIERHLSLHEEEGKVLSARSLLHVDSIKHIEAIIDDVASTQSRVAIAG